ncbi:glycosyltransferase [Segetibacter aerophilus]|uniref:Beta-1,4-galactosyltransferase n=1 Tax=Segetibacter aerophilus TaxID=670293 RepID=A0A512BD48_9BACT|nr:glycosyltransferase [Segetibacter aerophilus]GEO09889.1 beta-1,4-galactosyltransferase [Segetibacter aerophilus]
MIFITIGTQEPFDRLIKAMDEIAPLLGDIEIVAQVSDSGYKVNNMKVLNFVSPIEFNKYFNTASLIISHAGMGTIISALEKEKPIIVMPRLVRYGEHRSDHQLATADKFKQLNYVHVASDEFELKNKVLSLLHSMPKPLYKLGKYASNQLIGSLESFLLQ